MIESRENKTEIDRLWQEAELYENQGLYDHALSLYQTIFSREPDNRKAQAKIVQVQFAKKMEETTASRSSDTDKLSPRLTLDLGIAYMEMHLYAEALDEFRKALKPSPIFGTEILRFMAMCLIRLNKVEEAQNTIEQLLNDRSLTLTEKGDVLADCLELYLRNGLWKEAWDLFSQISDDQKEAMRDLERIARLISEKGASVFEIELEPEPEKEEELSQETDEAEYAGGAPATHSDAQTTHAENLSKTLYPDELSIPVKAPVSYSLDNKVWRDGVASRLSAEWALVHLPEDVDPGESLVLQLHLPTGSGEPVWVISRVAKHVAASQESSVAGTKVKFVSFLPGGEGLLKSFMDDVVQNPSLIASDLAIAKNLRRNESTEVFASLEAEAIKALEANILPELDNDTVLIETDDMQSETEEKKVATGPLLEAEEKPKIRFACECGQVHTVPLTTLGRKGKCGSCGRAMTVPAVDMRPDGLSQQVIGQVVGGCRLLYKIGGGGMGGVFKGHHIALDIPVAVKILHAHLAEKDPVFIKRFIREARAAARLQHANIVGVMNVGYENGVHFLVMPFVGGGNAAAMLARIGRYPVEKVLRIAIDIAHALIVAEENGVLHRDIKPANILFTNKGQAMLADLGLAKSYLDTQDTGITQTGIACGTPLYFSPEQAKGSPNLDIRSDIYSLGITLFHLLNGSPPFTGESAYVIFQKHVHEALPAFKAVDPPIPDSVFRVLQVMTEKDPTKRYATCSELLVQLETLRQEILAPPPPVQPKNTPSRKGILERLGIKKSSSDSNRND